jgi:hypothetical protein
MYINLYSAFVLSCPWAIQLSRVVPADAGFINAAVVDAAIEERLCLLFLLWRNRRRTITDIKTLDFWVKMLCGVVTVDDGTPFRQKWRNQMNLIC